MLLLLTVLRTVLGVRLLAAGTAKSRGPGLRDTVARYQVLPAFAVPPTAAALPLAEAVLGAALVLDLLPVAAADATAVLHLAFAAAITVNLLRGRSFDCGCRGTDSGRTITWGLAAQNLGAAALAGSLALRPVALPPAAELLPLALTLLAVATALRLAGPALVLLRRGRRINHALTRNTTP